MDLAFVKYNHTFQDFKIPGTEDLAIFEIQTSFLIETDSFFKECETWAGLVLNLENVRSRTICQGK